MAYDGKIVRRALRRFEDDKRDREDRARDRRESVFLRQPRLREIDAELRATMSRILSTALRKGTDPRAAVEALKKQNLGLQDERRLLLEGLGLPADCLEEKPACPLCGDSGWREGRMCRCLRAYCAREQQKELSRMLDLGNQSFESFSLEWYSETEGFSVVYGTAARVFDRFEARKFGREEGEAVEADVDRVLDCDLLILDDLGTEMTTPFVQSALYTIVNTRVINRRAAILSTNLKLDDLGRRYTPQIVSRIEGEYQVLPFFGEDIRRLRKERG